jgi:histidine phosphotransferase ChpT
LLLNMMIIAGQGIPRGGSLTVDPLGEGDTLSFRITAAGTNSRVPPHATELLAGTPEGAVDAHAIQPFYTGMLARASGLTVSVAAENDTIVVVAS